MRRVAHCDACGHEWLISGEFPVKCSRCKSRKWNSGDVPNVPTIDVPNVPTTTRAAVPNVPKQADELKPCRHGLLFHAECL